MTEDNLIPVVTRTQVYLTDPEFFCNKSWTISYNMNIKKWVSFHSYIPNFYIGENNFFYSGLNGCCTDLEGDFTALVGNTNKTTTSTTTGIPTRPSYTTTTRYVPSCNLAGSLTELFCELDGEVIITVPPTPTTTVCARPSGLITYSFLFMYTLGTDPSVVFNDSLESACAAFPAVQNIIATNDPLNPVNFINSYLGSSNNLAIGEVVYSGGLESIDCSLLADGWYLVYNEPFTNDVYQILNGIIVEITSCCSPSTTTTTTTVFIPECCGIFLASADGIYFYDKLTNTSNQLPVSGYSSTNAIAVTSNKLWSIDSQINEWDITLSPFTATFNRNVATPVGFITSAGIVALDDLTLVGIDSSASPQDIVEMDITGVTATSTVIGSLQANRIGFGNLLYTTDGKLVVINRDSVSGDYYISQYEYSTGTLELEINVGAIALTSIFECNCTMYVTDVDGNVYVVIESTYIILEESYTIELVPIYGATQVASCVTNSINPTTTTTTTTP